MRRLTTDKKVSEMGMYELAHNFCYVGENGSTRYRDFSSDVDCREMIKKIMANFGVEELGYWDDVSDEEFDDEMMENLMYGTNDMQGLIALFYRNMWAMADLRERLKHFEDLEEKGLLLKLPCKVGDTVYSYEEFYVDEDELVEYQIRDICIDNGSNIRYSAIGTYISDEGEEICVDMDFELRNIGESVFLTKEEAEKELKRLENAE